MKILCFLLAILLLLFITSVLLMSNLAVSFVFHLSFHMLQSMNNIYTNLLIFNTKINLTKFLLSTSKPSEKVLTSKSKVNFFKEIISSKKTHLFIIHLKLYSRKMMRQFLLIVFTS